MEVPAGEVRTYTWIAREIGRPAAVRAVGSALGRNPVPLLIPCHRVVRSDGTVSDYIFGAPVKRALLRREGADPEGLERLARQGIRYLGSDTTRIYCFPTCRAARRITERHRVPLASARLAQAAGYRPCRLCRPAA
jgi:O-6-methylguanine DNA methyltransferase